MLVVKEVILLEGFFLCVGHEVSEACARRSMKPSNSS